MSPLPPAARKEFERAVALFNEGRLATADGICSELIARFPADAEVAHLGGVVANRMGRYDVAVERLNRCVEVQPGRARAHAALGFALERLDDLERARHSFGHAIQADPKFAEAYNGLGVTLLRMGRPAEAVPQFERAIALDPQSPEPLLNAARALQETGRFGASVPRLRAALSLARGRAAVIRVAAIGLQQAKELVPAAEAFEALLRIEPGDCASRAQRAIILDELKREAESHAEITAALQAPGAPASVHNAQGVILLRHQDWEGALAALRKALEIDPAFSEASLNLAMALRYVGRVDEAIGVARAAEPHVEPASLARLAGIFEELGESDRGIDVAERAVKASPHSPDAHTVLATQSLGQGRLERGWREHVYRPSRGHEIFEQIAAGTYPPALPARLDGAQIIILMEQGLGDLLFFLRFAKPLADAGARLRVMRMDARMEGMVGRALPVDYWPADWPIPAGTPVVWSGDLPVFVKPLTNSDAAPTLRMDPLPERLERMRARLGESTRPRIGVAWRAGTPPRSALPGQSVLSKEIDPRAFGEALKGLPVDFVSLQRQPSPDATRAVEEAMGAALVDCSDVNGDLEDMLALLAILDDYAGVSSTNVHLRACVGKAGRVLVPFPPDWRWQRAGESTWFPGYKTYRQSPRGDWTDALAALREDIGAHAPGRK